MTKETVKPSPIQRDMWTVAPDTWWTQSMAIHVSNIDEQYTWIQKVLYKLSRGVKQRHESRSYQETITTTTLWNAQNGEEPNRQSRQGYNPGRTALAGGLAFSREESSEKRSHGYNPSQLKLGGCKHVDNNKLLINNARRNRYAKESDAMQIVEVTQHKEDARPTRQNTKMSTQTRSKQVSCSLQPKENHSVAETHKVDQGVTIQVGDAECLCQCTPAEWD